MRRTLPFQYKKRYCCTITVFRGTVISTQKNRTVYSRDGGDTRIHNEFFLRDKASGKEEAIELENWNLSLREGHDVAIVWIQGRKEADARPVAIYNYSLGEEIWAENQLPAALQIHKPVALVTFCSLLWFLWLILSLALVLKLGLWKPRAVMVLIGMSFFLIALTNHVLLNLFSHDRDKEILEAREALRQTVRTFAGQSRGIRRFGADSGTP